MKMKRFTLPDNYTPLNLKDFDIPPKPTKGNKTPNAIYTAVGRSLSQWEATENTLVRVFVSLIHPEPVFYGPSHTATMHVFGALASPRARIDVIREAAQESLVNQNLSKSLNEILKILERASTRRNEIAHGQIAHFAKFGHALIPHLHNPRKLNRRPNGPLDFWTYRYTSREINSFAEKFIRLYKETWNLYADIHHELRTFVEKSRRRAAQIEGDLRLSDQTAKARPSRSSRESR